MIDYFVIKRGNIHTPSLFIPAPGSLYYYTKGWNLKALACWVSAALFGIPGLVGAYHPTWVAAAAVHMYQTGWVICFAVAATFYYGVNRLFPPRVFPAGREGGLLDSKAFESLAASEGYFDDEPVIEFGVTAGRAVDGDAGSGGGESVVSIRDLVGSEKV